MLPTVDVLAKMLSDMKDFAESKIETVEDYENKTEEELKDELIARISIVVIEDMIDRLDYLHSYEEVFNKKLFAHSHMKLIDMVNKKDVGKKTMDEMEAIYQEVISNVKSD